MNEDAYIGIADAYIGMGDTEKAIEWLKKGYELTGDERLKNMIDKLNSENSIVEATTVTSKTEIEVTTEESKPTELQISYADDWYSVFNYDKDGNILNMALYNKDGDKRLSADYAYTDSGVERTVYVDNNLYETYVIEFTDIMAGVEKQKKERANTKKEKDNFWWIYDENGDCIEYGWHNFDSDGEIYYNNGIEYKQHIYSFSSDNQYYSTTYYDEKGYPINEEYSNENYVGKVYTYEYDEYGYPVVQYESGRKMLEYTNFYKNKKFVYSIRHIIHRNSMDHYTLDHNAYDVGYGGNTELNENGQYVRYIDHTYQDSDIYDLFYTHVAYFVPSFDETKMIDVIWIDCSNTKPLFECPYCND